MRRDRGGCRRGGAFRIARADTLQQFAGKIGAEPAVLAGTIARYNADCEKGRDTVFFKDAASGMRRLVTPPFYAAEIRPTIICWTGTGLRIDAETRVLRRDESPIPDCMRQEKPSARSMVTATSAVEGRSAGARAYPVARATGAMTRRCPQSARW